MKTAQSERELFALLAEEFGAGAVVPLKRAMERHDTLRDGSFYALKNENPALSKRLTELYDGETLPQFVSFLQAHRRLFGKTVLDVGCDNGLATIAVADLSPQSEVTGLDRCAAAIDAARQLSPQTSICFVTEPPPRAFETVLSLRTLHENFDQSGVAVLERLPETGARLAGRMAAYARELTGFVAEGGFLLSIERCPVGGVLLGWLLALDALGFTRITHRCILSRECGAVAEFHAMAFERAASQGARAVTARFVREQLGPDSTEAALLQAAEQFSFELCAPDGARLGWSGAWRLADGGVLAMQASSAGISEKRFSTLQGPGVLAALRTSMENARKAGYQVRSPAKWNL